MKLLVLCSSLDLRTPFSSTPAWWQLLKALHETGVELAVTTYHGRVPETLWWRAYDNPARRQGDIFSALRKLWRNRFHGDSATAAEDIRRLPSSTDRLIAGLARSLVAPSYRRCLGRIMEEEKNIGAVLFLSVPPNHLRGVANSLREKYRTPVFFFDGDVPASLPDNQGFATGFRIYDGAEISEFDAVISNSSGGETALAALGARAVRTVYYAADPRVYVQISAPQDIDVFYFGHTAEYRSQWLRDMITVPSMRLPDLGFAVRGKHLGSLGRTRVVPYLSFSRLPGYVARSKVNLVITRDSHARTPGSSTMRPFELAMMGACMVCNPAAGADRWFEPGKELLVVEDADEAVERYRFLTAHERERRSIGEAARRRALAEHTFHHRALQLRQIISEFL